ncbi:MAG: HSP90 family protein [Zavarzinella sp.]
MDHKFQINLRGIIDLLSEHLYSGPDVYVRELLQNAVDAITARRQVEPDYDGEIQLEIHQPKGKPPSIVIIDNGLGLTPDEVHQFLATIGHSSKRKLDGTRTGGFIGQFGIGILSCFVVREEIVVISKSLKSEQTQPVEWRALADGTYQLKELDHDLAVGTQVWLTAKEGMEAYFQPEKVMQLCRHYGGLLPYPIDLVVGNRKEQINAEPVPWRRKFATEQEQTKALLKFGEEVFDTRFFDAIPISTKSGKVDGVAYILAHAPAIAAKKQHRVYLKNMFLSDAIENLLPDWAFFIRAIVNADDLRPTASRESFYEDKKLQKARTEIAAALRNYLVTMAEHRPEKLEKFVALHQRALKALAVDDDEFYEVIINYLPFETNMGRVSFGDYRQQNDHIRFMTSDDTFRQVAPFYNAEGIWVVNAGFTYDAELLMKYSRIDPQVRIVALEPQEVVNQFDDLNEDEQSAVDAFQMLADKLLRPFRCISDFRKFQPADVPCMYITSKEGRFFRSLDQTAEMANPLWQGVLGQLSASGSARVPEAHLCFNYSNKLIQRLIENKNSTSTANAIKMLYVQSLLLGHHPLAGAEIQLLNDSMIGLIESSISAE